MNDDRRPVARETATAVDRIEERTDEERIQEERIQPVERDLSEGRVPLFAGGDADGYRTRWSAIQTGFVDEPRRAVEEADVLVSEVVKRLSDGFAEERRRLESAWDRKDEVSTEDLRQAMRRYHTFFERLLVV
jgi:hypothetical protein